MTVMKTRCGEFNGCGKIVSSMVNRTSSAVRGVPFENLMFGRSLNSQVVGSMFLNDSASSGMSLPLWSWVTSDWYICELITSFKRPTACDGKSRAG